MKMLNNIENKNPFKVPENYFEDVNRKIISRVENTQTGYKSKSILQRLRPILAVAASVAVFIFLSYAAAKLFIPETKNKLAGISIEEFSESYLNDIDILTLEQDVDASFLNEETSNLSSDEIINYLLVENIDYNEIYERL